MKKLLVFTGALFAMNVFAADCGLYIKDLDNLLKDQRTLTFDLKKFAEKKNFKLKFTADELEEGDLVIDQLISKSPGGTYYHIPAKSKVGQEWIIGRGGKIFQANDYSNEKRDYSRSLLLAEFRNGAQEDIDTINLEWSIKYKKIKKQFGDTFDRVHTQVEAEVIKELIKELPRCNK